MACSHSTASEQSAGPATDSANAALADRTWLWETSTARAYSTRLESSVALGPGQPLVSFTLEGNLNLQVRQLDARTFEFVTWMPDGKFTSVNTRGEDFAKVAAELAQPMGFKINDGALQSVSLDKGWSNFAASIGRALISPFQLPTILPLEEALATAEVDATGQHEVRYERLLTCPTDVCLSKSKVKYAPLPIPAVQFGNLKATLTPEVLSSSGRLELLSSGVLRLFTNDDQIKLPMGPTATATSHTKTDLKLIQDTQLAALDWNKALENTRPIAATAPYLGPMKTSYDELRIGDYTFDSALKALIQVASKTRSANKGKDPANAHPADTNDQQTLQELAGPFRAMAAILRSQPEHLEAAVRVVEERSLASRSMIDALAMAQTEATTDALVRLLQSPKLSSDWRGAVTSGIVRAGDTRPEVVKALQAVLHESDLRVHALYGLGTLARKLAEHDDAVRADAIARVLVDELRHAPNVLIASHALRGISNSGRPIAIPAVAEQLSKGTPNIRAAAAQALRLMKDERADGLLAETLLHDKDKTVRRAAAEAAAERAPSDTLSVAIQNAVTSDPDPKVRKQLVEVLNAWLPTRPELATTLALVAAEDSRPSVRDKAASTATDNPL
jgi:hypothetical protein